jgi:transposase
MELSSEEAEADGFAGKLARRTRSGGRLWPAEIKGRAVFESMKPGARVCEVARRYGVKAQQLTTWRRLARTGRLALVTDEAAEFCRSS